MAKKTNHTQDIVDLRMKANGAEDPVMRNVFYTASDLLEMHDRQSLSLDKWSAARKMVEHFVGHPIRENHV